MPVTGMAWLGAAVAEGDSSMAGVLAAAGDSVEEEDPNSDNREHNMVEAL